MERVTSFFQELIFEGNIPFREFFQKGLIVLTCLTPFIIFFPREFKELGEMALTLLFLILIIRPLAQIFPRIKLFSSLLPFRKEVGLLCGALAIAHPIGFFLANNQNVFQFVSNTANWQFNSPFLYAMLAFVIAFLLFITSNRWSMLILKQNWKRLHKLTYTFFFLAGTHAMLISQEYAGILTQMIMVIVLVVLAARKVVIWK